MGMNRVQQQTENSPCSEALWLAVRYLGGELSPEESAAFEEQLADDSVACEALSQAVILSEAVRSSEVGVLAVRSPAAVTRRSAAWFRPAALLAAAAVLLLVGWFAGNRGSHEGPGGRSPEGVEFAAGDIRPIEAVVSAPSTSDSADGEVNSMLSVWVELSAIRDVISDTASAEAPEMVADPAAGSLDSDVPEWMFAALLVPG
ncbi:MAG: hypothetical protein KDA75_11760, partial [Planctomycetaceae bacterium]|nr:hypothetical protein [Planctomycetaceae bacterium]